MRTCVICGSEHIRETDDYYRCSYCGVVRTKFDYDARQYDENYAVNYLNYAKSPVNKSLNLFRLGIVARWLKSDAKILDVGCCVGEFLRFAENYYKCVGFEPNPVAAKAAISRTQHATIVTELNGHSGFDCVTMFDVIEHIQEPILILKHLHNIINPAGILVITTPCVAGISDALLTSWKHYKPKEHLFLHTYSSLEFLLKDSGFRLISREPGEGDIRPGNEIGEIITCVAKRI